MRPQDGSPPKMPDLTRLPPATARARSRATARSGAPATSTTSSFVAPSPSAAMARASSPHSAVSVACSFTKSAPSRAIARAPATPVGEHDHRVVGRHVAVDGDGVERVFAASASAACSTAGATVASVVMKQSIVASCGMDHPRALGDGRELDRACRRRPSRGTRAWCARSVVRIASARRNDVVAQRRDQRGHRGRDPVDRQPHADRARRRRQHRRPRRRPAPPRPPSPRRARRRRPRAR